ncbi:MAG: M28 family peptidase [Promethearchaeota archaeon]
MSSIKKEFVPSTDDMMNWTEEIFNQGIRRPGYPADQWAENWIKEQFEIYNLQDIKFDPIPVNKWEASDAKLKLWLVDNPNEKLEISCFPIPYTSPNNDIEAELSVVSEESELNGKILVSDLNLFKFPVNMTMVMSGADRYYDPKNEFENLEQTVPFDIRFQEILKPALENNALGFIGILSGYVWDTDKYYVPYDAVERNIPGVWVSRNKGKKIIDFMNKGKVKAKILYDAKISEVISHNITGILPGMSDEWIVIGTHHDGPWNSAVEDASGMALVLAQAKYWSQIPQEQRPFNLMFLMNCAHMTGGTGAEEFVKRNKDFLTKAVAAIHLEHVARDVKSENGKLIPLDDPTIRWWFTSRILPLEEIVEKAIIEEDLHRSIILPPDNLIPGQDKPPTDGGFYHPAGIPFVSFLTAPPYLFDTSDTMDKIHQESFVPITQAVIRIINSLIGFTAKELRDQILTKKERRRLRRKGLK